MRGGGRLAVLVAAAWIATSCGREIDSRPAAASVGEEEMAVGAATDDAGAGLTASPSAPGSYRTHLYTERDADVHALFDTDEGAEASYVRAIHVDVGRSVGAGQVLAVLEDARQNLAVEAARARADQARAESERAKQLLEEEVIPRAEHEALVNAARVADAELRRAELEWSRTRVRAPFAGVVARRYVRVGQRVEPDMPLFRVTALAPLRARLLVPERQAGAFRPGGSARVRGVDGVEADGRVVLVSPTVDPGSGTREVVVELSAPKGLLPGAEVVVEPIAREVE